MNTELLFDTWYKCNGRIAVQNLLVAVMSIKHSELAVTTRVVLFQIVRLGPLKSMWSFVSGMNDDDMANLVGMVSPDESVLVHDHCDFMEGYWTGESCLIFH